MASFIAFELEDPHTEIMQTRRFEAVGVHPDDLWLALGEEGGPDFFDFIEDLEMDLGTIDQSGQKLGDEGDWTIGSGEIEDRDAFVERVTAKIREMTGWTLVERP